MKQTTCASCNQLFLYHTHEHTFDGEEMVPCNCQTCEVAGYDDEVNRTKSGCEGAY